MHAAFREGCLASDGMLLLLLLLLLRFVQAKPMEPNPLQKKKVWEGVQPLLRTDAALAANFKGAVMQTAEGPVTAASLAGARIG
jgi:hypothetical protein